jgi:mannose-6-phosphate isomerase-like protein (cupin superfamily)
MIDIINKHIQSQKGVHIKKGIEPFGWNIVIRHLQECADEVYAGMPNGKMNFQLYQAEEIPEVKTVIDYLNEDLDLKIFDAHIFTSFTKTIAAKKHADNHNVLLWSITGNMIVNLFDSMESEEPFYSEQFNQGDLVYIPADMLHSVQPTGARALVSFGIEVAPGKLFNSEIDNPYFKIKKDKGND